MRITDVCVTLAVSDKDWDYLLQDGSEEPFNIRLHLAKDILTIQEQDVICVSGEPFYSSVSSAVLIIKQIDPVLENTKLWRETAVQHLLFTVDMSGTASSTLEESV